MAGETPAVVRMVIGSKYPLGDLENTEATLNREVRGAGSGPPEVQPPYRIDY